MASGRPGGGGVSKTASSTHSHKPVAVIGAGSIIALAVCESGSIRLVINTRQEKFAGKVAVLVWRRVGGRNVCFFCTQCS